MWFYQCGKVFNDDENRKSAEYLYADRSFSIEAIYPVNIVGSPMRGRTPLRYEIVERWTSMEQPKLQERNYYIKRDKESRVLFFTEWNDAAVFLQLLAWVLNAPKKIPLDRIIAPELMTMIINGHSEELQKLLAKEAEDAEKHKEALIDYGTKVYCFTAADGRIKIGYTKNIKSRISKFQTAGTKIIKYCHTQGFTEKKARDIESECHDFFKKQGKHDELEWFYISYDEAKAKLQTYGDVYESPFN